MASSIFDRLLGRTETKAVTGPGAYAMTWYPSITSLSAEPHKLMAEGEALFHSQPWVNAAERALGSRFVRMDWHLEDENGDTVDGTGNTQQQGVLRLLEQPSRNRTRGQLWGITFRHLGLAGNAFWYLDQRDLTTGQPTRILYINPARVSIVNDKSTGERKGYILDARDNPVTGNHTSPGTPLEFDEVLHFTADEGDWNDWGVGIPVAAQRKIELDRLADTHAGGVLGSGGRLSGLITPKVGENMSDDQWLQFSRDWRRIAEDPHAAKRLQIAKVPLDFTQMTASPKDLQLIDVSTGSRDDILAIWGVPKSQLGMNVPSGLNADRSEADDAAIWETIKGRAEIIREKVQGEGLDRWAAGLNLVFGYPEFDDDSPLYENAVRARYIPMTNNQRLAIIGLDPIEDEELGNQIWVASDLTRLDKEPDPVPSQLLPPPNAEPIPVPVEETAAKARLNVTKLRERAEQRYQPRLKDALRAALADQRGVVVAKVRDKYAHLTAKAKDTTVWWNEVAENERLEKAILPVLETMTVESVRNLRTTLILPAMKADPNLERIIEFVRREAGKRIAGINETTRTAIAAVIADGVRDGLPVSTLAQHIEDAATFGESRAELISRTETMLAYNEQALTTFREYGAEQVEAIDGDDDPECANRNGTILSINEARGVTDHPNGTLDWVPVI